MTGGWIEVVPRGPVRASFAAPGSKSVTNRLLVLAALAEGRSVLRDALDSDDSAAMRGVLRGLGAEVDPGAAGSREWIVHGGVQRLHGSTLTLDARLSGTTMRFATAVATLASGPATLGGAESLLRRPIGPLVAALRELGADIADEDGYPPVTTAGGGLEGGAVVVDSRASSQFASALLMVAPYARRDVRVETAGATASSYIDLTAQAMREWGAVVERAGATTWDVVSGKGYAAREATVEYDASAAAHLLALAVATGGEVEIVNATPDSRQPDVAVLDIFEAMGAEVRRANSSITVTGPDEPRPVNVDLGALPDMITTVAALAALAPGRSVLHGAEVTRGHETDRPAALATELRKLGARVQERADGLVVEGGGLVGPALLHTHRDHRLAMAFAAVAARVPGVRIAAPAVVAKTYPRFWDDLRDHGVELRAGDPSHTQDRNGSS